MVSTMKITAESVKQQKRMYSAMKQAQVADSMVAHTASHRSVQEAPPTQQKQEGSATECCTDHAASKMNKVHAFAWLSTHFAALAIYDLCWCYPSSRNRKLPVPWPVQTDRWVPSSWITPLLHAAEHGLQA